MRFRKPKTTIKKYTYQCCGTIANVDGVNQEALDNFNQALVGLMQTMLVPNDKPDE